MASNVTRDHHNLRRNLNLNDNYISNDGGNEGIRIADDGKIGLGQQTAPGSTLEVTALAANNDNIPVPQPTSNTILSLNICLF